jgi:hypothetical protein
MPATQSASNGSLSSDFERQFDQAHQHAKSVFASQKELIDTLGTNQRALACTRQIRS